MLGYKSQDVELRFVVFLLHDYMGDFGGAEACFYVAVILYSECCFGAYGGSVRLLHGA
jgi:hypothetical protein